MDITYYIVFPVVLAIIFGCIGSLSLIVLVPALGEKWAVRVSLTIGAICTIAAASKLYSPW